MDTLVTQKTRDGVSVVTIDNPPVNALGPGVPEGLSASIRQAAEDDSCRAVVIIGAGRTFSAGADIRELEDVALGRAPRGGPVLHDLLASIEDSPKPVVMAMHGTVMGGGLELAMAGHYRIAPPSAAMSQPEVTLGIIPGAEGSQRLPRLVGVQGALEMCVSGRPIPAAKAFELGLIDLLVEGDLLDEAVAFAGRAASRDRHPVTRKLDEKLGTPETNAPLFQAAREQAAKFWRGMSAPLRVIEAIEAATTLPFDAGCRREREIAADCLDSEECRALIHAFFAERVARKIPDIPADTPVDDIRSAAVVGAGAMGSGIAMALANAGIPVRLTDMDPARLDQAISTIRKNYEASLAKGRLTEEALKERIGRIRPQTDYAGFSDTDLLIEAVFESMDVKKDVVASMSAAASGNAILATNTSTLDVDQIAGATSHPENVVGLHFFNPAHVMRLVEVVRGPRTGQRTVASALDLTRRLRKVGVLVGNCRGFVGNRMMFPYMREAQYLVEEGASPSGVDRALYDFGMAMGIFAVDDMGGLDLQWHVRQEENRLGLGADRPLRVLPKLCEMGRLGQKTGSGWYRYAEGSRTPMPDPEVEALIRTTAREAGIEQRSIDPEEIIERTIYVMVNEGARILEEGHALRASDIDTIYLTGYGFPRWRGGPMWYADVVGLDRILERIRAFQRLHGNVWEPAPLLERLVRTGRRFQDLDAEAGQGSEVG